MEVFDRDLVRRLLAYLAQAAAFIGLLISASVVSLLAGMMGWLFLLPIAIQ